MVDTHTTTTLTVDSASTMVQRLQCARAFSSVLFSPCIANCHEIFNASVTASTSAASTFTPPSRTNSRAAAPMKVLWCSAGTRAAASAQKPRAVASCRNEGGDSSTMASLRSMRRSVPSDGSMSTWTSVDATPAARTPTTATPSSAAARSAVMASRPSNDDSADSMKGSSTRTMRSLGRALCEEELAAVIRVDSGAGESREEYSQMASNRGTEATAFMPSRA
eukprot:scaffold16504_cov105-Isochrysis_galbana.AAC.3